MKHGKSTHAVLCIYKYNKLYDAVSLAAHLCSIHIIMLALWDLPHLYHSLYSQCFVMSVRGEIPNIGNVIQHWWKTTDGQSIFSCMGIPVHACIYIGGVYQCEYIQRKQNKQQAN